MLEDLTDTFLTVPPDFGGRFANRTFRVTGRDPQQPAGDFWLVHLVGTDEHFAWDGLHLRRMAGMPLHHYTNQDLLTILASAYFELWELDNARRWLADGAEYAAVVADVAKMARESMRAHGGRDWSYETRSGIVTARAQTPAGPTRQLEISAADLFKLVFPDPNKPVQLQMF